MAGHPNVVATTDGDTEDENRRGDCRDRPDAARARRLRGDRRPLRALSSDLCPHLLARRLARTVVVLRGGAEQIVEVVGRMVGHAL